MADSSFLVEHFLDLGERGGHNFVAVALNCNKEVVGCDRLKFGRIDAQVVRQLTVQIGTHADECFFNTIELFEILGDDHERNRVVIGIRLNIQLDQ